MTAMTDASDVRRADRGELSPLSFLERSKFVHADKVAVVHEDRRYSCRELGQRVRRLASALRNAGPVDGDRVGHRSEHPGSPGGAPRRAGGLLLLVAVNHRLNAEGVGFILEHSGARVSMPDDKWGERPKAFV